MSHQVHAGKQQQQPRLGGCSSGIGKYFCLEVYHRSGSRIIRVNGGGGGEEEYQPSRSTPALTGAGWGSGVSV